MTTEIDYDVALEIASHEAIIRQAYRDSQNVWTWGVGLTKATGHAVERYIGKPQPLEHCLAVYVWALGRYAKEVREAFAGTALTKAQFAAALSFHFNTGAIKRASWVKSFKAGRIAAAKRAFMAWSKPKEIIGRRKKERDLFFDGKWSNNGTMTEYTQLTSRSTPVWSSAKRINVEKELRAAMAGPAADPAPTPPARPQPAPAPAPAPANAPMTEDRTKQVQERLRDLGYFEVGEVDGKWGSRSRGALLTFKADNGLPLTPDVDDDTMIALMQAAPRVVGEERATTTADDLAKKSVTVERAQKGKFWSALSGFGSAIVAAFWGAMDYFGDALEKLEPIKAMLASVPAWLWFSMACGVAFALWKANAGVESRVVEDYRKGKKL